MAITCLAAFLVLMGASFAWLSAKASAINTELDAAAELVPTLKNNFAQDAPSEAAATVDVVRSHTAAAKAAADDPLWTLASSLPGIGANFSAVAEVARSADDVVAIGLTPLVKVYASLDWDKLLPSSTGADLKPLQAASPTVSSAATAIRLSADRLDAVDVSTLLPQVADPLSRAREQLNEVTGTLDAAAAAAEILPVMLGAETPRSYLLMIQNNAEARASGGIPGALATLSVDDGKMTMHGQTSAAALGPMAPSLALDPIQEQIYSPSMGTLMQDVNMTPDFPSAAKTAGGMWEQKTGTRLDGVLSVDPVALSYVLAATGPVELAHPELENIGAGSLPAQLSGENVVQVLLSDVYSNIHDPSLQDAYFAHAAQEIFRGISSGNTDTKKLIAGITRAVEEGRISLWSEHTAEQAILAKYPVSGSISGPSIAPAQFGVYFNDGTGAKMDYHVQRSVQLFEQCSADGYREVRVQVISTNTAPPNAAATLSPYVTGNGSYGVTPGFVQTNVIAYGPVQSNVNTAIVDGTMKAFAAQRHDGRPVGTLTTRLSPGQSITIDFTFTKIVQHSELKLDVTPTVQPVKDVVLASKNLDCD